MANTIELNFEETSRLQDFRANKQYAEAYRYLRGIVGDMQNRNYTDDRNRLQTWLDRAASINANDGSFASEFVRGYTESIGQAIGKPISDLRFQEVSDRLAESVIRHVLDKQGIPDSGKIISQYVQMAVLEFNLPDWGWAGVWGDSMPTLFGGLGKDYVQLPTGSLDTLFDAFKKSAEGHTDGARRAGERFGKWLIDVHESQSNSFSIISESVKNFFTQSRIFRYDPLVLDLDGDGIETIGSDKKILFDHDNDGIKTATGWVSADDGLLVMDRNGNGVIDAGHELFGDSTKLGNGKLAADGFAALSDQDTNQDGKVDSNDTNWKLLKVWRDLNQDGVSQANELFTLDQVGIASLNVAKKTNNQTLGNGNQLADSGTFTRTDGRTGNMSDVNFAEDAFHRQFTAAIAIVDDVKKIPNMQGAGKVRDLREAATQSSWLKTILVQYSTVTTRQEQSALLDSMLSAWADTSGMEKTLQGRSGSRYNVIWKSIGSRTIADDEVGRAVVADWERKLYILEAFNGQYYFEMRNLTGIDSTGFNVVEGKNGQLGTITVTLLWDQVNLLNVAYETLRNSVYENLLLQTRFKPLMDQVSLKIDANEIRLDYSAVEKNFEKAMRVNPRSSLLDILDFNYALQKKIPGARWVGAEMVAQTFLSLNPEFFTEWMSSGLKNRIQSKGSQENDLIVGGKVDDFLVGGEGDDIIFGRDGNNYIEGGTGNDLLHGDIGNDTLYGCTGNDLLYGGDGSDTLKGDERDDKLFGGNGDDFLYGGEGEDVFDGGVGNDVMNGNGGKGFVHIACRFR